MTYLLRFCFWPAFFCSHLIAITLFVWHLAAQFHFAYPLGYQLLELESHIAEYAPLNRHKEDFELTTKEDHWRLFGEISDAIQNDGKGLADIHYTLSNGQSTALMHQAEIIHLQDVANLIDIFYVTGIISGIIWLSLLIIAWLLKLTPPSLAKVSLGFMGTLAAISLLVLLIGAKKVFYWLHTQIFPDNHQWFFYYQDSLMTTLMKAPDIFAFITLILIVLLIACWGFCYWAMSRFLPRSNTSGQVKTNSQAKKMKSSKNKKLK